MGKGQELSSHVLHRGLVPGTPDTAAGSSGTHQPPHTLQTLRPPETGSRRRCLMAGERLGTSGVQTPVGVWLIGRFGMDPTPTSLNDKACQNLLQAPCLANTCCAFVYCRRAAFELYISCGQPLQTALRGAKGVQPSMVSTKKSSPAASSRTQSSMP